MTETPLGAGVMCVLACLEKKARSAALNPKALAAKYTANWKAHAEHSDPYQRQERFIKTKRDGGGWCAA